MLSASAWRQAGAALGQDKMASRAVANTGDFFSISLQNPYDKHHLFRLLGCLLCFGLVCLDAVLLTFSQVRLSLRGSAAFAPRPSAVYRRHGVVCGAVFV